MSTPLMVVNGRKPNTPPIIIIRQMLKRKFQLEARLPSQHSPSTSLKSQKCNQGALMRNALTTIARDARRRRLLEKCFRWYNGELTANKRSIADSRRRFIDIVLSTIIIYDNI